MNAVLQPQKDDIARRLKGARENLGITQLELAKKTELSRSAIMHYENGNTVPGGIELAKLCYVLQSSPNIILSGLDEFSESQKLEHSLAISDPINLAIRMAVCLTGLEPQLRQILSELVMNIIKERLDKEDYESLLQKLQQLPNREVIELHVRESEQLSQLFEEFLK